ncbi:hypothetical protein ABB37_08821 [Leptomonas pyrrhocoris]|uniref:Uncharacterized protein n=1 Tax=Leptomonas pyrrhocoris TaxID=157538 RepID=A0A0M9FSQ0_LEPPY|nr:hypothetical protein ABB37_08821 [Leptomonas pyrrhocoris]KPA75159.1 hypothetical protein ABB37_08821 [Leptomonas pyrrhocoris]|eukprot:XP_015653598.1 hypothetical protein ABB37_08821 [Leptomonas pyrrhocoris]
MYTRESVSTDRYNGDESGSGREDPQNTTTVSSDWSVRPSDDTVVDAAQTSSLSRLNPAATPFSFTGGAGAVAAAGGAGGGPGSNDLVSGGSGGSGGLHLHHLHHHRQGVLSNNSLDGAMSPTGLPTVGRGHLGAGGVNANNGSNSISGNNGMAMDGGNSPSSFGVMQGMMSGQYRMVGGGGGGGGHRQSSLTGGRSVGGMMDFGMTHGGGGGGMMSGGLGGANPSSGLGGGGGRSMGSVGGGLPSPNSFLPPPGEESDQQELLRLQQTNYRVKMLPPPLTYEVHRKIWSRNEYGDDNDDDLHGAAVEQQQQEEEESLHNLVNEDPVDKEQRLEAYKQIMLRWYGHIHVLESKSEVAKRLVRVRRACPSMEEVMANLSNQSQQQQQCGAAMNTPESEGGDDDASSFQRQQQPAAVAAATAAFTRRSPSTPLDAEEVLSAWSAQCWDWWQETVKRKPRRARKQGEVALGTSAPGLPTSASAPMVAAMGDGPLPHSLSARAMEAEETSPQVPSNGNGSPYTHHSPYTSHPNGPPMEAAGNGTGMPMAPSYTSFTDLSEEGGVDAADRSSGQSPQQHSRALSHSFPQVPGQQPQQQQQLPQQRTTPPQQQQQQTPSHAATSPTSTFTTNGIRAAAPRTGNPDDFLENDHLTLAFTTELLKSLEE